MPKMLCLIANNENHQRCTFNANCWASAVDFCIENDLHDLVIIGESEYSYKDNHGYVRGKKPIGPQRAAKKRRKI